MIKINSTSPYKNQYVLKKNQNVSLPMHNTKISFASSFIYKEKEYLADSSDKEKDEFYYNVYIPYINPHLNKTQSSTFYQIVINSDKFNNNIQKKNIISLINRLYMMKGNKNLNKALINYIDNSEKAKQIIKDENTYNKIKENFSKKLGVSIEGLDHKVTGLEFIKKLYDELDMYKKINNELKILREENLSRKKDIKLPDIITLKTSYKSNSSL